MLIRPVIKNKDCREYKYLTNNGNKIRLDSLIVKEGNLYKSTYFGKTLSGEPVFEDFLWVKTPINGSKPCVLEASIAGRGVNGGIPIPPNYIAPSTINSKIGNYILFDNKNFQINIDVYEDEFNLSFCDTVGLIISLVSSATLSIPFNMQIIIDSNMGINIKDFHNTLKKIEGIDTGFNLIKEFIQNLNIIYKKFKDVCDKENRKLRLYISIGDFGSFINVIDTEYDNIKFLYNINNTDHCRMLRYIDAYVGNNYTSSEQFGTLYETKLMTLVPSLFDTDEEKEMFLNDNNNENYITRYF
jgi:hypothetical protein